MTAPATRVASAAGGVVFRHGPEGVEIVVVLRHEPPLVALPKGKPDAGESVEATALREVREETGLETRILERLGEVRYWFPDTDGTRVDKTVTFFLMEPAGGALDLHDHEFDEVVWMHLAEAERRLTHQNQLHILERAGDLIRERAR
ncbi:MAG: NUDIX hydrolase [Chloroflexota bacterium]